MKGHLFDAVRDLIEFNWVNQWKDRLENPHRKPCKVMHTYLENLGMTKDALDAQFNWACWDAIDKVGDDLE